MEGVEGGGWRLGRDVFEALLALAD
jgi:hypothetical protein